VPALRLRAIAENMEEYLFGHEFKKKEFRHTLMQNKFLKK
jgi:hypothetical protein